MSIGLHNKKNFKRFLELRHLIQCNPIDVKLLKQELKENYYQQRLNSLSDLKCHLDQDFEKNFFGKSARVFFGTKKYKFSKRELTVTCYNQGNREVTYNVVWENDNLSLSLKSKV